jgi:hypothetical protein
MNNGTNQEAMVTPSTQQILKATGIAAVVAALLFFAFVLPAEVGKDPLHTGALLGLTNLSKTGSSSPGAASSNEAPVAPAQEFQAPVIKGVFVAQPNGYKVDSRELKLQSGDGIEIKYHMQKGSGMVYSWTANEKVFYELHGEPDVKPTGAPADYFESYEKDDQVGKTLSSGTFTAPTTGIQGWFWDNESGKPVVIKLVTAGFYDYILQNKDDVKTRLEPQDPK